MTTDYICNPENMELRLKKHMEKIQASDLVLVFSCGVGVQTIAEYLDDKKVCAACDTYPLPGFQGVTPLEYKCDQCGECYLNLTGGIVQGLSGSPILQDGKLIGAVTHVLVNDPTKGYGIFVEEMTANKIGQKT